MTIVTVFHDHPLFVCLYNHGQGESAMKNKNTQNRRRKGRPSKKPLPYGWIAGLALVILLAVVVAAWPREESGSALPDEITVAQAVAKRDAGAFILDVRQPEEWEEYHIPGSTLIPLEQLDERVSEVPKDQEVVVVCRSGNRSQTGRDILLDAGYSQVTSMAGGLSEWRSAGYPTISGG
jgi:rhodanese-related sulfurtransferase